MVRPGYGAESGRRTFLQTAGKALVYTVGYSTAVAGGLGAATGAAILFGPHDTDFAKRDVPVDFFTSVADATNTLEAFGSSKGVEKIEVSQEGDSAKIYAYDRWGSLYASEFNSATGKLSMFKPVARFLPVDSPRTFAISQFGSMIAFGYEGPRIAAYSRDKGHSWTGIYPTDSTMISAMDAYTLPSQDAFLLVGNRAGNYPLFSLFSVKNGNDQQVIASDALGYKRSSSVRLYGLNVAFSAEANTWYMAGGGSVGIDLVRVDPDSGKTSIVKSHEEYAECTGITTYVDGSESEHVVFASQKKKIVVDVNTVTQKKAEIPYGELLQYAQLIRGGVDSFHVVKGKDHRIHVYVGGNLEAPTKANSRTMLGHITLSQDGVVGNVIHHDIFKALPGNHANFGDVKALQLGQRTVLLFLLRGRGIIAVPLEDDYSPAMHEYALLSKGIGK